MPLAIVFTPHPDDEAYAFGGTICRLVESGWRVQVEVATAGEQGERHDGGQADARSVGIERLGELAMSCQVLGADSPHCWGLPDGRLATSPDQSERIARIIRERQPALVLSLGADGAYGHPDHLALHRWLSTAVAGLGADAPPVLYAAFPRGLFLPQWELCIGMMGDPPSPSASEIGTDQFDHEFDVVAYASRKRAAIAAHVSQLPGGDPANLFPGEIVPALLAREWFTGSPEFRPPWV